VFCEAQNARHFAAPLMRGVEDVEKANRTMSRAPSTGAD
jgi:hypothetical protein